MKGKADAILAASNFHFGTYTVGDVKQFFGEEKNSDAALIIYGYPIQT